MVSDVSRRGRGQAQAGTVSDALRKAEDDRRAGFDLLGYWKGFGGGKKDEGGKAMTNGDWIRTEVATMNDKELSHLIRFVCDFLGIRDNVEPDVMLRRITDWLGSEEWEAE